MGDNWEVIEASIQDFKDEGDVTISGVTVKCGVDGCEYPAKYSIGIPLGSGHTYCIPVCNMHRLSVIESVYAAGRKIDAMTEADALEVLVDLVDNDERALWLEHEAVNLRAKSAAANKPSIKLMHKHTAHGYERGVEVLRKQHDKEIREFVLDGGGEHGDHD